MVDDDDLRFGDRDSGASGGEPSTIIEKYTEIAIRVFVLIVVLYALYQALGILFPVLPFA